MAKTHKVTDADLAKLVAKHRKANPDATASRVIKALRSEGYSFSGKRVRVLVAGKPATAPKKATEKAKSKAPVKKSKPTAKATTTQTEQPAPNKNAAKVRDQEQGLGIQH